MRRTDNLHTRKSPFLKAKYMNQDRICDFIYIGYVIFILTLDYYLTKPN